MKKINRNRMFRFVITCMLIFFCNIDSMAGVTGQITKVSAASSIEYAAQLERISIADGTRNINITGYSDNTALNTWITNGGQNENWRFDYISDGVFRIVNMGTGMVLSPYGGATSAGTSCVIAKSKSAAYQYWNVTAISTDQLGNNLYYKITNYADSSKALTYNSSNNTISLQNYTGETNQKFLLNTAGLGGFAGDGKDVSKNVKASNIGGLLGKTVYVSTFDDFAEAISGSTPKTIVITNNITYSGGYTYDSQGRKCVATELRLGSNKTIIGSYTANNLHNVYLRTTSGSSNNVILRNITLTHDSACNSRNTWEFTNGENLWLDHITFTGHSSINTASTGGDIDKFLAIKGTCNYVTVSDCSFGKHEYGVLMGYPADTDTVLATYKGMPCVTMSTNYFNGCVTRGPGLMRYGYFHCLNNYVVNFDMAYTMHTAATIYTEKNYYNGGNGSGSVVNDNALGITEITNASVSKVGPWFKDSGSVATNCSRNNNVSNINSATTSWRPNTNYSYNSKSASSVPDYCITNAGAKSSRSAMSYTEYVKTGVPSANYLTTSTDTGTTISENVTYSIKNVNSGLYLDVKDGTKANGTNVQQWGASSFGGYNTWKFVSAGDGYYYIYSMLGDGNTYLLDVENSSSVRGTNIQIYENTYCDAQLFKLQQNSDGSYIILTKSSSDKSCVEVKNADTSSGANVQQWDVNGATCQNWTIEAVN